MAKKRRKRRTKTAKRKTRTYHRKNPKRVAAGRKAAAARWGKKTKKKKSSKRITKTMLDRALSKLLGVSSRSFTVVRKKRRKKRAPKAVMFGPIYDPKARSKQNRLNALAKARVAKAAKRLAASSKFFYTHAGD